MRCLGGCKFGAVATSGAFYFRHASLRCAGAGAGGGVWVPANGGDVAGAVVAPWPVSVSVLVFVPVNVTWKGQVVGVGCAQRVVTRLGAHGVAAAAPLEPPFALRAVSPTLPPLTAVASQASVVVVVQQRAQLLLLGCERALAVQGRGMTATSAAGSTVSQTG